MNVELRKLHFERQRRAESRKRVFTIPVYGSGNATGGSDATGGSGNGGNATGGSDADESLGKNNTIVIAERPGDSIGTQLWISGTAVLLKALVAEETKKTLVAEQTSNHPIIDLGCGVGLLGIAVSKMSCDRKIVLTDKADVLPLCMENVINFVNFVKSNKDSQDHPQDHPPEPNNIIAAKEQIGDLISVLPLDWLNTSDVEVDNVISEIVSPNGEIAAGTAPPGIAPVTISITASECLYDTRLVDGFIQVLTRLSMRIADCRTRSIIGKSSILKIYISMSRRRADAEDYFFEKILTQKKFDLKRIYYGTSKGETGTIHDRTNLPENSENCGINLLNDVIGDLQIIYSKRDRFKEDETNKSEMISEVDEWLLNPEKREYPCVWVFEIASPSFDSSNRISSVF